MAVDRENRDRISEALARVARGDGSTDEIEKFRENLYPRPYAEVSDKLARSALDWMIRHSHVERDQRIIQVTPREWGKLRRWIAILHTDIDWNNGRNIPHDAWDERIMPALGCVSFLGSVGVLYVFAINAWLVAFFSWLVIGVTIGIVGLVRGLARPESESEFSAIDPFDTKAEMEGAFSHSDRYQFPEYDSTIHGRGLPTTFLTVCNMAPWLMFFIPVWAVVWPVFIPDLVMSLVRIWRQRQATVL